MLSVRIRGLAKHLHPRGAAQHEEKSTHSQHSPFRTTISSQREIYLKSLGLASCETSSHIGGQGLEMSIPGPLFPHKVEQGLVSSLLPRPPPQQEESGPVRIGKVQNKNYSRPPLTCKKGIPASIGRDSLAKVPAGWLTRPFSGLL